MHFVYLSHLSASFNLPPEYTVICESGSMVTSAGIYMTSPSFLPSLLPSVVLHIIQHKYYHPMPPATHPPVDHLPCPHYRMQHITSQRAIPDRNKKKCFYRIHLV